MWMTGTMKRALSHHKMGVPMGHSGTNCCSQKKDDFKQAAVHFQAFKKLECVVKPLTLSSFVGSAGITALGIQVLQKIPTNPNK
jgi:hypothetical protein